MANTPVIGQWDGLIKKYADQEGVPFELAKQVMLKESSGNPNAQSPTGPKGLFQLSKATAIDAGIDPNNRFDPETNIKAGVKTLKQRYQDSGGDWGVALGMYNQGKAGFTSQQKSGNFKPEVVNYVSDPRFSEWTNQSRVKGIANPVNKLNAQKQDNKFSPEQLTRSALNNAPTQADVATSQASMTPQADINQQKPANSLLQNQEDLRNAQEQQRLQTEAEEQAKKKSAYRDMGYMVLGAILGRNSNTTTNSVSGAGINSGVPVGQLKAFGNKDLSNFQIANGRG